MAAARGGRVDRVDNDDTGGRALAAAQTVMFRHAPPGEARRDGPERHQGGIRQRSTRRERRRVPLSLSSTGKTEIDANIFVDICDKLHRVIVVERNRLPDPQQPGCARRDISGLYWVRPVNTLVVDVADGRPSLLLVKGSYNPERPRTGIPHRAASSVYGGGTIGSFRDAISVSCGNVTNCKGDSTLAGFTAAARSGCCRILGAESTYVKPTGRENVRERRHLPLQHRPRDTAAHRRGQSGRADRAGASLRAGRDGVPLDQEHGRRRRSTT